MTIYGFCSFVRSLGKQWISARIRASLIGKNAHLKNLFCFFVAIAFCGFSMVDSEGQFIWTNATTSPANWSTNSSWGNGSTSAVAPSSDGTGTIEFNISGGGPSRISNNNLSNFTVSSLTINSSNGRAITLTGNSINLSGNIINNTSNQQFTIGNGTSGNADIRLLSSISVNVSSSSVILINSAISENSTNLGMTKLGTGTLTLNGSNTFNGSTTISAGTLSVNSGSAISDSSAVNAASGAVFRLLASETIGSIAGAGNVTLGANTLTAGGDNTSTTFSGNMSGSGGFTKAGTGTLTMSGTNAYSGTTTISGGTLAVSGGSAIADGGVVSLANTAGVQMNVNSSETIGSLQGGGGTGGTVSIAASQTLTVAEVGTNTFSGVITGSGGFTKNGSGTLTLGGSNTYTGVTTLNTGTLRFSSIANGGTASGIGQSTNVAGNLVLNGGELDYTGGNASSDRGFTVGSGGAALNVSNSAAILTITGGVSGTGILTKSGGGTLQFVGNSVAGNVTVSSGTLAGNATISGLVTLNSGASLVPGNGVGGGGTLTASNGLTLNPGGTVRMDLSNTSGSNDSIAVSGDLAYGGTLELTVSGMMPGGNFTNTYNLFTGSAGTGDFSAVTLAGSYLGSFTLVSANTWTRNTGDGTLWTFNEGNGTLTVIPEPSTWALMSFGVAFVLWRIRRRKACQR